MLLGADKFTGVPLSPVETSAWPGVLEVCERLTQRVALVGLSAVQAGIATPGSRRLGDIARTQPLFDTYGQVNSELAEAVRRVSPPSETSLIINGVRVAAAAVQAARLISAHPPMPDDYTGRTHDGRFAFTATIKINEPLHQRAARDLLEAPRRVTAVRVRLVEPLTGTSTATFYDDTEIHFAAPLMPEDEDGEASSGVATLRTRIDEAGQTVEARVVAGQRDGDFVSISDSAGFDTLARYTELMAVLLSN